MSYIISSLLSFLLLYKYWALFVVIFSAAVILPIPTNSILLAAGAFASQGYFGFFISLIVAVSANVLGDCFGYFLARRYGRKAIKILHIRIPSYIERFENYVGKHPRPMIFLTRFFGTADSLANLFAGFIGMPIKTFLLYDFLGNLVSTGYILYAGYLLGINWLDFSNYFSIAGWIVLGVVVILLVVIYFWNKGRHNKK